MVRNVRVVITVFLVNFREASKVVRQLIVNRSGTKGEFEYNGWVTWVYATWDTNETTLF